MNHYIIVYNGRITFILLLQKMGWNVITVNRTMVRLVMLMKSEVLSNAKCIAHMNFTMEMFVQ